MAAAAAVQRNPAAPAHSLGNVKRGQPRRTATRASHGLWAHRALGAAQAASDRARSRHATQRFPRRHKLSRNGAARRLVQQAWPGRRFAAQALEAPAGQNHQYRDAVNGGGGPHDCIQLPLARCAAEGHITAVSGPPRHANALALSPAEACGRVAGLTASTKAERKCCRNYPPCCARGQSALTVIPACHRTRGRIRGRWACALRHGPLEARVRHVEFWRSRRRPAELAGHGSQGKRTELAVATCANGAALQNMACTKPRAPECCLDGRRSAVTQPKQACLRRQIRCPSCARILHLTPLTRASRLQSCPHRRCRGAAQAAPSRH